MVVWRTIGENMKLDYKRTVLVGFAFLLISAFWQAYDAIIPLILTNRFGLLQSVSGAIMSVDNVLAVFLLPLFGAISDKHRGRFGRRTPFVLFGTVAAVVAFAVLTVIDNVQLSRIIAAGIADMSAEGLSDEAFAELVREKTIKVTLANPWILVGFIATLLVVLIAMATFRSPAVALMPDVTPRPLRSKGNAVINLLGASGAISVLILGMIFGTSGDKYMKYTGYVIAVCALMLLALIVFMLTVKEKKWAEEADKIEAEGERTPETCTDSEPKKQKLTRPELKSLLLILASVALWYIGYNSITSKYSVYAENVLHFDFNLTLIVAQAAAIVSFIPVGIISSRFGRKKTILAGVLMLTAAFFIGNFVTAESPELLMYPIFALAGIGWATINVNSFPMVVELSRGGDVGKYTGYYYTASMAAQIVAPIISGVLYDLISMRAVFFAFGTVFVALSFVTMLFVKHGDSILEKRSFLENFDND